MKSLTAFFIALIATNTIMGQTASASYPQISCNLGQLGVLSAGLTPGLRTSDGIIRPKLSNATLNGEAVEQLNYRRQGDVIPVIYGDNTQLLNYAFSLVSNPYNSGGSIGLPLNVADLVGAGPFQVEIGNGGSDYTGTAVCEVR